MQILSTPARCADDIDSTEIYMERASTINQPSMQESLYHRAIRLKPDCAECYLALGKHYLSYGEYEKALSEFYFAGEFDPGLEGLHYYTGYAYEMLNDFSRALEEYYHSIALDHDTILKSRAHLSIGSIYDAIAMPESSSVHFRKSIENDSSSAAAVFNLGISYDDMEMYQNAIACYNRAYRMDSTDVDALINLGVDYCRIEDYKSAIDMFHEGLNKDPDNFKLNYNLANTYLLEDDLESARIYFEKVIELEPERSESYYQLARIYDRLEMYKLAEKAYGKFLKLAPPAYEIAVENAKQRMRDLQKR